MKPILRIMDRERTDQRRPEPFLKDAKPVLQVRDVPVASISLPFYIEPGETVDCPMLQRQGLVFWNTDEVRNQWLHLRHYEHKGCLLSIRRQRVKMLIESLSREAVPAKD
jgi:hypothetical protein